MLTARDRKVLRQFFVLILVMSLIFLLIFFIFKSVISIVSYNSCKQNYLQGVSITMTHKCKDIYIELYRNGEGFGLTSGYEKLLREQGIFSSTNNSLSREEKLLKQIQSKKVEFEIQDKDFNKKIVREEIFKEKEPTKG